MLIFLGIWHLLVYCPLCHWEWGGGTQFTCFTGTKVQILTPNARLSSPETEAEEDKSWFTRVEEHQVLSLLALLVQKYKY